MQARHVPLPLTVTEDRMSRHLLLQSLLGHLALLAEKHPKKAATPVAKAAKRYARLTLTQQQSKPLRRAA